MTAGSAIPPWIREILPPWFAAHPVFTEAAFTFARTLALASVPIFATLYGIWDALPNTDPNDAIGFFAWLAHHWFALFMGYVGGGSIAGLGAHQAAAKAAKEEEERPKTA